MGARAHEILVLVAEKTSPKAYYLQRADGERCAPSLI
jgi:hypothetical protein